MKIARTVRFQKAWKELNEDDKELAKKALRNMVSDLRYPALRVKKIKGVEGIWEARVSQTLRITFQIQGDTIMLRNIGRHDETLERP